MDQLLTRISAASGEPWRFHVVSRSLANIQHHIVETRIDAQGQRVSTRRCSANVCVGTYVDGAWNAVFSYNETPIPQPNPTDSFSLALRTVSSYEFASQNFRALGGRIDDLGTRPLEDRIVRVLAVTSPDGATVQALIDPATALLRGIARGDGATFLRYDDQRRVGPLTLPFSVRRENGTADVFEARTIDPQPLSLPVGPPATFAAEPETVALNRGGGAPRFPCRVEDVATTCLLDTGASGLAMSLDLADRLHKNIVGQIELEGLGTVLTGVVRAASLDLGGLQIGSALYAVLPDAAGFKADVVLGADVIGRSVVRLDLHARTISFFPLGTALTGTPLPLAFDRFTPTVAITLGDLPTRLAIDTGDESSIDLPIAFYRAHPGLFTPHETRHVMGVGGRGEQSIGRIGRVRLGNFTFSDVPIGATDVGSPTRARLGAGFLSRLVVELDYANAQVGLRARK